MKSTNKAYEPLYPSNSSLPLHGLRPAGSAARPLAAGAAPAPVRPPPCR